MHKILNRKYTAFTLIEVITTLIISGILFLGLFYVFTTLNSRFEKEFVRRELLAYCTYALDDISKSIRTADNIIYGSNFIASIDQNDVTINNYMLDNDEGIIKNGIPIQMNDIPINFNPNEKNGYVKYKLDGFEISLMANTQEYTQNAIYSAHANVTNNTLVIKLLAKIIMGNEADNTKENIIFKRVVFSPGMYFSSLPNSS